MTPFPMPTNLVGSAEDESADRRDWMAGLPRMVDQLAQRWSLRVGAPYQPGGQCSWTAPAWDSAGRDVVLKVGWAHDEARHEADGLRAWAGDGAVYVYDTYSEGQTSAMLLERCEPGTALSAARPPDERDAVVAAVLRRLWTAPTDGPFRSLASMCACWADSFETKLAMTPAYDLDAGLVRVGVQLFRDLPPSADRSVLLATDLHAENILAAQRRPWLVIDPKPYVGDPTYDVLQHLLNIELMPDPGHVADRMADRLDLDRERLRRWLFARCVVESITMPWLREVARALAP